MGIGIGFNFNTSNRQRIQIKDAYGRVTGTISISRPKYKKQKKLKYNSKQISSQLMKTKTSFAAARVAKMAKLKVNMLKQKMGTGEYDSEELRNAIIHAEKIERVAKKRKKHLQEEEKIQKNVESGEDIFEEDPDEEYYDYLFEDLSGLDGEDLQKRIQEYEEMIADLMQEMEEEMESEEMDGLFDLSIIPDECDEFYYDKIKRKHRSDELKDIMEADLKYLKAMFEKYGREMQEVKSGMSSAVSMQLGGVEMPVPESVPMSISDIGGYIDQFT